ncbi:unnamed protein product [Ixodes hexagonus]
MEETDGVCSKLWNNAIRKATKDLDDVVADQSPIDRTVTSVDGLVAQVSQSVERLFPTAGKESPVIFEEKELRSYLALERKLVTTAVARIPAVHKDEQPEASATTTTQCKALLRGYDALKAVRDKDLLRFSNASKDTCCAELVNQLVCPEEKRFDCDTWAVSASTPVSASENLPASSARNVLIPAAIAATLGELVTANLRSKLDDVLQSAAHRSDLTEDSKTELLQDAGDLGEQVAKSCVFDITEARYSREVGKATGLYNSRVELLKQLAEQNARLRRVWATQQRRIAAAEAVWSHVAEADEILRSRHEECTVIGGGTQELRSTTPDAPPVRSREFAADPECAASFDKLCEELRGALFDGNRRLKAIQNDQRQLGALVADSNRELLGQCQGSVPVWCADQKLATKQDPNDNIVRELFKEFHRNPDKFVKRMKARAASGVNGTQ